MIDLGPDAASDPKVRQQLAAAVVGAKLEPVIGGGVEDALAGIDVDRDALLIAGAIAEAANHFGALACPEANGASMRAVEIGAARQASGLAVPELARAWAYLLLCADRTGDTATAYTAAGHLRTLGGSPDVDAKILARYPEVDALSNREAIAIKIEASVQGADVWVDFKRVGTSPLDIVLSAGPHIIAAGRGPLRGVVTGTVVRKQPIVKVPMADQAGPWRKIAARVASWKGATPSPAEIGVVLGMVNARVALVREGNTVEAWGRVTEAEPVRRLGGDDGTRKLDDTDALVALIADRIETWNERAPDPDRPLLVETDAERRARLGLGDDDEEQPTRWWVYATVAGALLAGAAVIYAHDSAENTQRIEVRFP